MKDTVKFQREVFDTATMLARHKQVLAFDIVGSARYSDDAKDVDILVLADYPDFCGARWMFGNTWTLCAGKYDDQTDKWGTLRKGNANLIVTVDRGWYDRMKVASEVCAALKLMDKGDRIVVHRVVRDGYDADGANARRAGSR
jgi:hypothetical protein